MATRILRGDAPDQAQVWRVKPPLIEGAVKLRVGNKTLEFTSWSASAIATAWNASKWAEMKLATAAASGSDVVFTARTAGVPFYVWITVGSTAQGEGTGRNEVQTIQFIGNPSGGTFNADFEGDDVDIDYDADGAEVQTDLLSLDTLEAGDVTVTGAAGGPWIATFAGRFAGQDVPLLVVNGANLTGGDAAAVIQTIQDGAAGSTGNVSPEADATAYIQWNDDHIDDALFNNLLRLGRVDSTGHFFAHSLVRFTVAVNRGQTIDAAELALVLTGRDGNESTISGTIYAEAADDPTFPTTAADGMARPLVSPGVDFTVPASLPVGDTLTITGLAAIIQAVVDRPGWVSGNQINLHLRATAASDSTAAFSIDEAYGAPPVLSVDYDGALREIQSVSLSGNPHGGQVTLTLDAEAMDPLDHDVTAAAAQANAELNANVGAGMVTCSGGPWPAAIYFAFDATLGNLPQMTATDTLQNGDVIVTTSTAGGPDIEILEEQRSRGANHADDPLNWQDSSGAFGVPEKDDSIVCPDGKVDLLWGLRLRCAFTADAATDRLLIDGQNAFWDGQKVEVKNEGGGLPAGLAAATTYYVRDRDGVFIRVSTTLDGPPVAITTAGTGTHTIGVHLVSAETDSRYTGKLGLSRKAKEGFEEFRPRFLEAWIDQSKIGTGGGGGSQRCHLDTGNMPHVLQLLASQGGTDGAPAVQWLGAGAGNQIEILGGDFGMAIDPEQAAEFDRLVERSGQVLLGRNVTAGDIERTGGTIRSLGAAVDGSVVL
jgi:hypothetical protein